MAESEPMSASYAELVELVRSGSLPASALVYCQGMAGWKSILDSTFREHLDPSQLPPAPLYSVNHHEILPDAELKIVTAQGFRAEFRTGVFLPAPTVDQILTAEERLGFEIPMQLRLLYHDFGGVQHADGINLIYPIIDNEGENSLGDWNVGVHEGGLFRPEWWADDWIVFGEAADQSWLIASRSNPYLYGIWQMQDSDDYDTFQSTISRFIAEVIKDSLFSYRYPN